jgi:hypothetical protein
VREEEREEVYDICRRGLFVLFLYQYVVAIQDSLNDMEDENRIL